MFCKECGKKLPNNAKFCIHCGAEVPEEVRELFAEEKAAFHFKPDPEFRWNTESYPSGEKPKTEEVHFVWDTSASAKKAETHTASRHEPHVSTEPVPQVGAESVPRVGAKPKAHVSSEPDPLNDTIIMDRGKNGAAPERSTKEIILHGESAEKALSAADAIIEDIKREEAEENARATAEQRRIDKFYTFNKKNEEFQQLLDKQIEKLKLNAGSHEEAAPEEKAEEDRKETTGLGELLGDFEEKLESELGELENGETAFDTRELNRDLLEIAMENAGLELKGSEVDIEPNRDKPELKSDFKPQFMLDAEQEGAGEPAEANEAAFSEVPQQAASEAAQAALSEVPQQAASEVSQAFFSEVPQEAAPEAATEAPQTFFSEVPQQAATEFPQAAPESPEAAFTESPEESLPGGDPSLDWEKKRALDALWGTMEIEGEAVFSGALPAEAEPAAPSEPEAQENGYFEEAESSGGIGRVIIALLMVVVIAEVILIGIRVYMPDSSIGLLAANELGFLSDWFFRLTGLGSMK